MTSTRLVLAGLLFGAMALSAAGPGFAQEQPKELGTFNSWTAWTRNGGSSGLECYISAQPEDWGPREVSGSPVRRSPIHFLVINRKTLGTTNEVQTLVGYPFHPSQPNASANVDGKTYPLLTDGEAAWLAVAADEPGFVEALKAGSKLVVKGTSQKGNVMSDTYNLSGVTAALSEATKACS